MGKAKAAKRRAEVAKAGFGNELPKHRGLMWLACVVLLVVTVCVYWQATGFSFIDMDDELYVFANPHVTHGLSLDSIRWSITGVAVGNWHPLTMLSLMTDYQLAGSNPRLFHAVNIIFHALNTLLLVLILTRMTGSFWRSWFVGALFALHPMHVESVAWISERKDVLSTLFWLLAMWAYLNYAKKQSIGRYLLVALAFILGLMSKPMVVSLPLVLLILDYWPLHRASAGETKNPAPNTQHHLRLLLEKLPLFALALGSCVVTFLAQRKDGAVGSIDAVPLGARLANAVTAYVKYAVKLVWPGELAPFYPHPVNNIPVALVILCALVLIGITVLIVRAGRTRPYLAVGWFWYLVTLVPVIGLIQVGAQSMADRYAYVPYIGLFIMAAWGLPELVEKLRMPGKVLAAVGLAALAAFTLKTNSYLPTFKDDVPFWKQITVADPNYGRGYYNLGLQLAKAGDADAAVEQYEKALKVEPDCPDVHNNLANILNDEGLLDEAIEHYKAEIKLNPRHALALNNLGIALGKTGHASEAIPYYKRALRIDPDYADAHYNLAVALASLGKVDQAIKSYQEVLKIKPDYYWAHNNLGLLLASKGRTEEACRHFAEAIRIDPTINAAKVNLAMFEK